MKKFHLNRLKSAVRSLIESTNVYYEAGDFGVKITGRNARRASRTEIEYVQIPGCIEFGEGFLAANGKHALIALRRDVECDIDTLEYLRQRSPEMFETEGDKWDLADIMVPFQLLRSLVYDVESYLGMPILAKDPVYTNQLIRILLPMPVPIAWHRNNGLPIFTREELESVQRLFGEEAVILAS